VNTVQPGFVDSDDVDDETRERIPMGRPARTAEVADAVAYLLTPASIAPRDQPERRYGCSR